MDTVRLIVRTPADAYIPMLFWIGDLYPALTDPDLHSGRTDAWLAKVEATWRARRADEYKSDPCDTLAPYDANLVVVDLPRKLILDMQDFTHWDRFNDLDLLTPGARDNLCALSDAGFLPQAIISFHDEGGQKQGFRVGIDVAHLSPAAKIELMTRARSSAPIAELDSIVGHRFSSVIPPGRRATARAFQCDFHVVSGWTFEPIAPDSRVLDQLVLLKTRLNALDYPFTARDDAHWREQMIDYTTRHLMRARNLKPGQPFTP